MLLWRSLHAGRRLATASVPRVCCCCRLAGPRRVADQVCRRRRRTLEPDIGHSPARFRCSFIFFLHVDRLSCELCGLPTPRNTSVHHCLRSRYQLTGLHSLLCKCSRIRVLRFSRISKNALLRFFSSRQQKFSPQSFEMRS